MNNMLVGMIGSMYLIKQLLLFARKGNMEFQSLSFSSLMKEVFKLTRVKKAGKPMLPGFCFLQGVKGLLVETGD